jgi:succinate dehydrogenase/fumarate reductase flavoprotein subunit
LGCSEARLVHSGNETGRRTIAILKKLLTAKGVLFWGDMMAGSLIKSEDKIAGAIALNKKEESIWVVYAKAVIVATGGGHLMDRSTYPISMTADGYAMAYRAGAKLVDMEFIQHEPCNAVFPKSLGISTTLLAKGGTLKNKKGERFVLNEYEGEYAVSKDSLSRMIALEIVQGRGTKHSGVYLDLTDLPEDEIKERHSLYYKRFLEAGIDISKEVVEVAPIAHSMMGGIEIAPNTSTEVPGLFASGEVTGGIHGANRVGGNAGTEIYVFGAIAGESAAKYADKNKKNKIDKQNASDILDMIDKRFEIADDQGDIDKYKEEIKNIMSKYMSPIREEKGLKTAIKELKNIGDSLNQVKFKTFADIYLWFEANNMQLVSELACRAALERQESRGVHFRTDYPNTDNENWKKNICFSDKKGMEIIDIK